MSQIKELYKGKITDKETLDLQYKHHEEKRKEKIRLLLEERAEIINNPELEQNKSKNSNVFCYFFFLNKQKINRKIAIFCFIYFEVDQFYHFFNKSYQKSYQGYNGGSSTLIEKEKQQLEKIKLRQAILLFLMAFLI